MVTVGVETTTLTFVIWVLVLKQLVYIVYILVFFTSMLYFLRYARSILVFITITAEIILSLLLNLGVDSHIGKFLAAIAFLEALTSLFFLPFDFHPFFRRKCPREEAKKKAKIQETPEKL